MNYQRDFSSIFHCFPTSKLIGYEPLWVDTAFDGDRGHPANENGLSVGPKGLDAFCYMVPGGECFDDLRLDKTNVGTMQAERYGGSGIGGNGGGARCGNVGKYQVKGIGQNPLAGSAEETWHSYGGLNVEDAVYEAIYANALSRILPMGVAKVHAIVATGRHAAYRENSGERGWGALLIRDAALRPAHFLRAGRYVPSQRAAGMISDVGRVRIVNKQLKEHFGTAHEFIQFLGTFLSNCANQFAFARLSRLMHGAVTPSNICFDGRWIDLTNCSFLPATDNTKSFTCFYEECQLPIAILRENLDTYNKYNNARLRIEPLANYYFTQLNSYFKFHLGYLFALNFVGGNDNTSSGEIEYILGEVLRLLSSGELVQRLEGGAAWPESLSLNDPMLQMLRYAYTSLFGVSALRGDVVGLADPVRFSTSFRAIVKSTFAAENSPYAYRNFCIASFIRAYKRAAFSAYYYRGRLIAVIKGLTKSDELVDVKTLLGSAMEISDWIFDEPEGGFVTLFLNAGHKLRFCCQTGMFSVCVGDIDPAQLSAAELKNSLLDGGGEAFTIDGFNFKDFLIEILCSILSFDALLEGTDEPA